MTPAQLQTLKTWDSTAVGSDAEKVVTLNATASPDYFVWKSTLGLHELTDEVGVGDDGVTATMFVHGGATGGYINRSQGERDDFLLLFNATERCHIALPNVRTALDDIFSGAGAGAVANRAHWRAKGRRAVTVGEKLFVIPTVGGPTQTGNRGTRTNPDTLGGFEGNVTEQDLANARAV